jgi:hypothetical protein
LAARPSIRLSLTALLARQSTKVAAIALANKDRKDGLSHDG